MPLLIFVLLFDAAICSVIGFFVGESRERPGQGALLGFLLGPIGIVLVLLTSKPRAVVDHSPPTPSIDRVHIPASSTPHPYFTQGARGTLRIRRQGKELGPVDLDLARTMLAEGDLHGTDFFFDPECQDWRPLDQHPEVAKARV